MNLFMNSPTIESEFQINKIQSKIQNNQRVNILFLTDDVFIFIKLSPNNNNNNMYFSQY